VVQHVEDFRTQLELEALRDTEVLQEARVQIPETRSLHDVAAIAVLSRRWDAEKRLCAGDVDTVIVWVGGIGDELAHVVHRGPFHSIDELHVSLVERASHLREADVRSVGRERTASDAIRLAALVRENASEGPPPNNLVRPARGGGGDPLAFAKGKFVQHIGQQHVRVVEVRKRAIQTPIVNIRRRTTVGRAQTATSGCACRVDRRQWIC